MKLKAILLVSMFAMMSSYTANAASNFSNSQIHVGQLFTNPGVIYSHNSQFSANTFVNDGEIIGDETLTEIICVDIQGTGVIKGQKISIQTKKFSFTGTIECDGECEIISEEPVDQNSFKQAGSGKFVFTVKK